MRRVIGDLAITAGSVLTLVLVLVFFDKRVRDQIAMVVDPRHPGDALAGMSHQAGDVLAIVFAAGRNQSIEHAPLVVFAFTGKRGGDDDAMLELLEPFRPHRGRAARLLKFGASGPPRRAPRARLRAFEAS